MTELKDMIELKHKISSSLKILTQVTMPYTYYR